MLCVACSVLCVACRVLCSCTVLVLVLVFVLVFVFVRVCVCVCVCAFACVLANRAMRSRRTQSWRQTTCLQGHRIAAYVHGSNATALLIECSEVGCGVQGQRLATCMCGSRAVGSLHQHCASTLLHCSIIQRTGLCMHVVLIFRLHDTVGCVACCMLGCGLHWLADRYV